LPGRIVNTNHYTVRTAVELRITDYIRDGFRATIPQPTERQHIGDQINAAFIAARADFGKRA